MTSTNTNVDPELLPLLSSLPPHGPRFEASQVDEKRKAYTEIAVPMIQAKYKEMGILPQDSEYTVTDFQIPVGGGTANVLARLVVPTPHETESDGFPLLFWIHGGGFWIGDVELDDYRLRELSVKLRIATLNVEYRMAPEHPFPTPVEDVCDVLKYVVRDPKTFSASFEKGLIVGGTSAGGNLAAVLAHLVRDNQDAFGCKLTGQLLHIPVIVHPEAHPDKYKHELLSLEENKDAPVLTTEDMSAVFELYNLPPTDPRASPLLLPSFKDLPPALVLVCGLDPLRDEGILYEKLLREAGVPTRFELYPGVPHGFDGALFFPEIKQAVKLREDAEKGIQWLLELAQKTK